MSDKARTRDKLIETARNLFWQQGYGQTGVAQILKTAEVNSGSLYHFFPTKEDLLLAVLDWYVENLYPQVIQPVLDRIVDPIERVFGILDGYRQAILATHFMFGCPIGNLALELAHTHPAARDKIHVNFGNWVKAVQACINDASGRLPESVDRQQLALFVLVTMEGGVMLARSYQSIEPFDAAVSQLREYFERLLADGTSWSQPRPAPLNIPIIEVL
jgi:TetR/AcrR family transcriptional repressor of nem operon